jgi:predicted DNA-binding transcriptional regulator AlpA
MRARNRFPFVGFFYCRRKPNKEVFMSEKNSIEDFDSLPDSAFVPDVAVASLCDCSRVSVWRNSKPGGTLPAPLKVGSRTTRWNVGQLRAALGLTQGAKA